MIAWCDRRSTHWEIVQHNQSSSSSSLTFISFCADEWWRRFIAIDWIPINAMPLFTYSHKSHTQADCQKLVHILWPSNTTLCPVSNFHSAQWRKIKCHFNAKTDAIFDIIWRYIRHCCICTPCTWFFMQYSCLFSSIKFRIIIKTFKYRNACTIHGEFAFHSSQLVHANKQ